MDLCREHVVLNRLAENDSLVMNQQISVVYKLMGLRLFMESIILISRSKIRQGSVDNVQPKSSWLKT